MGSNDKTAERERKREREKEPVSGVFVVGVPSKDKNNFVVYVPSLLPLASIRKSSLRVQSQYRIQTDRPKQGNL